MAIRKEFVLGVVIFIVSTVSFGFGYLANREFNHAPIIIEKCSDVGTDTMAAGK